jgi:ABC-type sugar transport system ATPase subunit
MNFVPGKVRDGVLDLGGGLSVPLPETLSSRFANGDQITLGIRPEHLAETQGSGMPFRVENVEALGADSLIHGYIGEGQLVVRVDGHAQPRLGATLNIAPRPDKLYFFDSASGKRI